MIILLREKQMRHRPIQRLRGYQATQGTNRSDSVRYGSDGKSNKFRVIINAHMKAGQ